MKDKKKKRRLTKRSKRRLLTLGVLSVVLFIFFCFNVITYSYKIISLAKEENNLKKELESLKTEREYLLVDIEKLQNPDYLAKYARETYYYSKEGEYVIKIDKDNLISSNDDLIKEKENDINKVSLLISKYKNVIITSLTIFSILVVFIIIKSRV